MPKQKLKPVSHRKKRYKKYMDGKDERIKHILGSVERNKITINPREIARNEARIDKFFKSQRRVNKKKNG